MTQAGTRSFSYDIYNHLTHVQTSGGAQSFASYSYDPAGRLASSWGTQGSINFAWSGNQMIAEFGVWGNILHRYVYGPGSDEVLVQYCPPSALMGLI